MLSVAMVNKFSKQFHQKTDNSSTTKTIKSIFQRTMTYSMIIQSRFNTHSTGLWQALVLYSDILAPLKHCHLKYKYIYKIHIADWHLLTIKFVCVYIWHPCSHTLTILGWHRYTKILPQLFQKYKCEDCMRSQAYKSWDVTLWNCKHIVKNKTKTSSWKLVPTINRSDKHRSSNQNFFFLWVIYCCFLELRLHSFGW